MLVADPRAVFTYPQSMHNEAELVQIHGTYQVTDAAMLSFNTYYRHFHQNLIDGNTTDVAACLNDDDQLCLEGEGDYPGDALYGSDGNPVSASALPPDATPGETDFTHTNTNSLGAAVQASFAQPILNHANNLVVGMSVDEGFTNYMARGVLGSLLPSLEVVGAGVTIDQALSPTAQPPIETSVNVDARNLYSGLYAIDVFDITPALSLNLSGRLNTASISLIDRSGSALNGKHGFTHFNPGAGVTYKILDRLTVYGGYSESNRAPTAGELSCADPNSPCLLDAFLVSDPKLKQVVSRDYEFGLRGTLSNALLPGTISWNASFYRTDSANDITLLATDINGFGFFQNSGTTRRQGADLRMNYHDDRLQLSASYSYLDATFRDPQILSSNSPAADADGLIDVESGNHLPLSPTNRITLSGDYELFRDVDIGADFRLQSGQYLVGDESNQEPKLPGYATVNLRGSWRFTPTLQLFAEVQNLLNRTYNTYGAFTELDGLPPNLNLSNPRTYSPAPPRVFYVGVRANLP
jgi:iron complex outermembrane recepter protein